MPSTHLIIPDAALREAVAEQLRLAKITDVLEESDGEQAAHDSATRLVILDEAALDPLGNGTLKRLADASICLLLLGTAADEETQKLVTESFPKPLRLGHLLARLAFHRDVAPRLRSAPFVFGPFRLEAQNRQLVTIATHDVIRLTEKEAALLEYLAQSPAPVPREELLSAIWGYDARIDTHTLETHIYQLRRKLDPGGANPPLLINEQGAYRLRKE